MRNKPSLYRVLWTRPALKALAKLFNIHHDDVFKRSQLILSRDPYKQADGVADYPDFKYNGYYWILIHNNSISPLLLIVIRIPFSPFMNDSVPFFRFLPRKLILPRFLNHVAIKSRFGELVE